MSTNQNVSHTLPEPGNTHADDPYLTLNAVARHLERGGKKPAISTIWRWCKKGSNGTTLRYSKFGRGIRVRLSDLEDFGRKLADADMAAPPVKKAFPHPRAKKPRTPEQRAASIAAAESRLKQRGAL